MTTWIGTNQAGWDNQSIGFHSVNGCTGVVLSTPHWVAGWHIGGGAGAEVNREGLRGRRGAPEAGVGVGSHQHHALVAGVIDIDRGDLDGHLAAGSEQRDAVPCPPA